MGRDCCRRRRLRRGHGRMCSMGHRRRLRHIRARVHRADPARFRRRVRLRQRGGCRHRLRMQVMKMMLSVRRQVMLGPLKTSGRQGAAAEAGEEDGDQVGRDAALQRLVQNVMLNLALL